MSSIIPIGQILQHDFDLNLRSKSTLTLEELTAEYAALNGFDLNAFGMDTELDKLERLLSSLTHQARSRESMLECYRLNVVRAHDAAQPAEREEWQPSTEVEALTNELLGGFERAVDAYRNQLLDAKWEGECHIDDMARFVVGAMLVGEQPTEE